MCGFLLRIIINALVILMVVVKLPGVFVDTLGSTLLGAAIIGFANAAVRPILSFLTSTYSSLALGGITFATNLFAPLMVVRTLPGYQISGIFTSMISIALITVCSFMLSKVIEDR